MNRFEHSQLDLRTHAANREGMDQTGFAVGMMTQRLGYAITAELAPIIATIEKSLRGRNPLADRHVSVTLPR